MPQPLVALKHGGNRRGKRRAEQDKYVRAWEAMLPYRLAFAEPVSANTCPTSVHRGSRCSCQQGMC